MYFCFFLLQSGISTYTVKTTRLLYENSAKKKAVYDKQNFVFLEAQVTKKFRSVTIVTQIKISARASATGELSLQHVSS